MKCTGIKKKRNKTGTLCDGFCRSRVPYRIMVAIKERNEKEEREQDGPRVHCLICVSLIKRFNRACYVTYMKIPLDESGDEKSLEEFLREKVSLLVTYNKKRRTL